MPRFAKTSGARQAERVFNILIRWVYAKKELMNPYIDNMA